MYFATKMYRIMYYRRELFCQSWKARRLAWTVAVCTYINAHFFTTRLKWWAFLHASNRGTYCVIFLNVCCVCVSACVSAHAHTEAYMVQGCGVYFRFVQKILMKSADPIRWHVTRRLIWVHTGRTWTNNNWAPLRENGPSDICKQQSFRRACASMQSLQKLCCVP